MGIRHIWRAIKKAWLEARQFAVAEQIKIAQLRGKASMEKAALINKYNAITAKLKELEALL